jgi:hypothetical protein
MRERSSKLEFIKASPGSPFGRKPSSAKLTDAAKSPGGSSAIFTVVDSAWINTFHRKLLSGDTLQEYPRLWRAGCFFAAVCSHSAIF